jgi:hypothetical protein
VAHKNVRAKEEACFAQKNAIESQLHGNRAFKSAGVFCAIINSTVAPRHAALHRVS